MIFNLIWLLVLTMTVQGKILREVHVQNESFILDVVIVSARDPITCTIWACFHKPCSVIIVDSREGCQLGHLLYHFPLKSGGMKLWIDNDYVLPEEVLHFVIIKPGAILDFSANPGLSPSLTISATLPDNLASFLPAIAQGKILLCSPRNWTLDVPSPVCYWFNVEDSTMVAGDSTPISHTLGYMISNGGKPWISGGFQTSWTSRATDQSHVYNEGVWVSGPTMPEPVVNHCIAQINKTHFLLAGVGICDGMRQFDTDQTWILNWNTQKWTPSGKLSSKRRQAACETLILNNGTKIVVITGGRQYGQRASLADVDIYNVETNDWIVGPKLPTPLSSHTSFVFNETLFVVAGGSNAIDNSNIFKLNVQDDLTGWDITEGPIVNSNYAAIPLNTLWHSNQN